MKNILLFVSIIFMAQGVFASGKPAGRPGKAGRIDHLVKKIRSAGKNAKRSANPGAKLEITEGELALYIMDRAARKKGRASLYSIDINFQENNIFEITAIIDFDLSEFFDTSATSLVGKILKKSKGIKNKVYMRARVASAKGKGILLVSALKLNGIKLPDGMVRDALVKIGKKQNPPLDPRMLMPMPFGIQKIEIKPGKLILQM